MVTGMTFARCTRVFVVDRANHLIAMCTPQRYICYMANQTYEDKRYLEYIPAWWGGSGNAKMGDARSGMEYSVWAEWGYYAYSRPAQHHVLRVGKVMRRTR